MPSAFDILGALSFVQGVITVVIALVLAFRASTEHVCEIIVYSTIWMAIEVLDQETGPDKQEKFL